MERTPTPESQEPVVPPPLAIVEPANMEPPDEIMAEESVTEVAANVAISTEFAAAEMAPNKRSRVQKGKTVPHVEPIIIAPEPITTEDVPFIPIVPEPVVSPPRMKIKTETKAKPAKKRRTSTEISLTESLLFDVGRTAAPKREKSKTSQEVVMPEPKTQPMTLFDRPGCKIGYATTSITPENVLTHKRIKKRPNYALMNEDADDKARARKAEMLTRSSDAGLPSQPAAAEAEPATPARNKRRKPAEPEEEDEDDDDDFTPKHVSRSKAARLMQETAEPGRIANSSEFSMILSRLG